jgi:DNA-binding MarR family transcriptional regulator
MCKSFFNFPKSFLSPTIERMSVTEIPSPIVSPNYPQLLSIYGLYIELQATFETALAPYGLSEPQWDTLRTLRDRPGASGADIARATKVSPQAVATMLQRLEKAELIERRSAQGRVVEAYLTESGEALLQKGDAIAVEIEAKILSGFSAKERSQFQDYLSRCVKNLEQD